MRILRCGPFFFFFFLIFLSRCLALILLPFSFHRMSGVNSEAYKQATASEELSVTSAPLMALARHIGAACEAQNAAFVKCKEGANGNPSTCVTQGIAVKDCVQAL